MDSQQLDDRDTAVVTTLPGAAIWFAAPKRESGVLISGTLDGAEVKALKCGGVEYGIIGLLGVDARRLVVTDGLSVSELELSDDGGALSVSNTWGLPGELGWFASLAAAPSGDVIGVASDLRLALFGERERILETEGGSSDHFSALTFLPSGALVVGRGDGRVELRSGETLEVEKTITISNERIMKLCALDDRIVAVADDAAHTWLLDVESGVSTELALRRMKTSGLHRLADGRLLVVGLSRRVAIFDGTTLVASGDLSSQLGDRYIQGSAVEGDFLLMACEARGLHALSVGALPVASPDESDDGAHNAEVRQAVTQAMRMLLDLTEPLLAAQSEGQIRAAFMMLANASVVLNDAPSYLRSANKWVRYYTADHYGQLPALFAARSEELRPVLDDPDPEVAAAAVWALGQIGDKASAAWLSQCLTHSERRVQHTAIGSILQLQALDALPFVVSAIEGGGGGITFTAMLTLWPTRPAGVLGTAPDDLIARIGQGVAALEILDELGVVATPELRAVASDATVRHDFPATVAKGNILYKLCDELGWAVTVESDTLRFTTPELAAPWWEAELRRRWS